MNIVVNGRNIELTPALRQYAEDKIGKFDRYLANISEAVVSLSIQKHRHKTEVLIKANGAIIQAESVTDELYSSIDDVVAKIDRQIKKHKGKLSAHRKPNEKVRMVPTTGGETAAETGRIIRKNVSEMKPMTPEEASLQMDVTRRGFVVFINSENGNVCVLYKMNDGNFGLIEPSKQ